MEAVWGGDVKMKREHWWAQCPETEKQHAVFFGGERGKYCVYLGGIITTPNTPGPIIRKTRIFRFHFHRSINIPTASDWASSSYLQIPWCVPGHGGLCSYTCLRCSTPAWQPRLQRRHQTSSNCCCRHRLRWRWDPNTHVSEASLH